MPTREIAIVIGHSHDSQGAANAATGITEWQFNKGLAARVADEMCQIPGLWPMIIYRTTYDELPERINMTNCDVAISLHGNAFNEKVSGCECLYHPGNKMSRYLAAIMQKQVARCMGNHNRGIEGREKGKKGGWVLTQTEMPTIIVEPFFIDNDADLARATERKQELAKAIVQGVTEYFS